MLTKKQKRNFAFILLIMVASAALSQLLPLAIGDLTNDVLGQSDLSFQKVIPFLAFSSRQSSLGMLLPRCGLILHCATSIKQFFPKV